MTKIALAIGKFPFVVLGLALTGLPLFVVISLIAMGSYVDLGWELKDMFNDVFELADKAHLLPIPLFVFAGFLLAIVSMVACTFFTTFTGASGVTIIALGGLLYPVLLERKYPEQFSLGLLTSAGSLGLLFFPALPVFIFSVVYGITTESADVTAEGLFLAGFIPGVLLTVVLCAYAWYKGVRLNIEKQPFSMPELLSALRDGIWEALLPFLLIGSIVSGICTLSEVATLTCVYLMVVEMVIHREIHPFRDLPKLVADAMVLVGAIVMIMAMIMPTKDVMADQEIPQRILAWFSQFVDSKIGFLIVLNLFLIVVGCLMDIFSAIVAVLPLLIPLAKEYGVEPLHLGVIFLTNLEIGYLTPPVGINLFISSFQFKTPVLTVYKSVVSFILLMFASLLVITYVPSLSLAIPNAILEETYESQIENFGGGQKELEDMSDEEFMKDAGFDDEDAGDLDGSEDGEEGDLSADDEDEGDLSADDEDEGDLKADDEADEGDLVPDD